MYARNASDSSTLISSRSLKADVIGRHGNASVLFARTRVMQLVDYRDFPFSVPWTHRVLGSVVAVAVGISPR